MQENNNLQDKENNLRHMKVLRGFRQDKDGNVVPLVQLTGTWMRAAGFYPDDKIVVVIINAGKIEIHKDRYA